VEHRAPGRPSGLPSHRGFAILSSVPEGYGSFREFGYLSSSARTRIASAVTNRQSMAIVIATRIQDDFSSNRPHLPCVGTARRSV
jgi:hypothetical protein